MVELGKLLIVVGAVILVAGVVLALLGRVPWIGRLPGDIVIRRDNFVFVFPLMSCLLVSVLISLVLYLLRR
ncbi:MAG TPA: DUF2905 domain-containing protein [Candidatus Binatia bacterium]|nr:DUF2905 domain-containing protein [Candidatus Binatia bacterium]